LFIFHFDPATRTNHQPQTQAPQLDYSQQKWKLFLCQGEECLVSPIQPADSNSQKKNKERKPNKLALLKQFNMVWLTSLLSYFGTSRTSSLTFIIMCSSSIKLAM
jgi:hypothetical protein